MIYISKRLLFFSFFLFLSYSVFSQQKNFLTIQKVAELTLENNKSILSSVALKKVFAGELQTAISDFNIKINGEVNKTYDILPLTIDYRENLFGYSNGGNIEYDYLNYNIGLSKMFKSGTIINPEIEFFNYGKDTLYRLLKNNGYGNLITNRTNVRLNLYQPILRGIGFKYNTTNLRINQKKYQIAEEKYYYIVSENLLKSFIAYLEYIWAKKNMEIQKNIDNKYILLIKQIEILVEQDIIPASDLNYIRANYLQSKINYQNAKNILICSKENLLNKIGLDINKQNELDDPPGEFYISEVELLYDESDILKKAYNYSLLNRNDYKASNLLLSIENDKVDLYKKDLLPKVDVKFSIGYNGIFESSGLEQLYKPYYENIPGINYGIGLVYVFDVKNDYNKGKYLSAKGSLENQQLLTNLLEEEIKFNLSKYLKNIINYSEITNINKSTIKYYEDALENESIKLKLGTSTVINYVQIQTNYYKSLEQLNNTLLDLNTSLLYFRFYSSTLYKLNESKMINIDYQSLFSLPYNDLYPE